MNYNYRIVTDPQEKRRLIQDCDEAFTISVTGRSFFEELFAKIDRNALFIGVFSESGDSAGYAAVYANDLVKKTAYITLFCIRKGLQGMHLGSRLMDFTVSSVAERGMDTIRLEVLKQDTGAIEFYKRNRFVIEGPSEGDSYYMIRKL